MRADRLISIILLLQNRGKLTTKELSKELEVTERTVHRDMDALSAAGIPVMAERGRSGGWRLLEHYRTNLTGLKENEIRSLFISPSTNLLNDLGIKKEWTEARQKLMASIPRNIQQQAGNMWDRIHVDTEGWRPSAQKMESFETLKQAIWEEKRIQITYEKADGEVVNRFIEPLGLVAKGSTWYLVASVNEEFRTYRVSRIQSAILTEEAFARPNHFHLGQHWEESTENFIKSLPKYEVYVEVSPTILQRIKFTGRFVQILHIDMPTGDGWFPVKLCFDTEQEAQQYILGFGNQIRIIQPKALKHHVYRMAKAVVDFYERDPSAEF